MLSSRIVMTIRSVFVILGLSIVVGCAAKKVATNVSDPDQFQSYFQSYIEQFGQGQPEQLREFYHPSAYRNLGANIPELIAYETNRESDRVQIEEVRKVGEKFYVRWSLESDSQAVRQSLPWYKLSAGGKNGYLIEDVSSEYAPSTER